MADQPVVKDFASIDEAVGVFGSVDEAANFFIRVLDKAYTGLNQGIIDSLAQRGVYSAYSDAIFYNNKGIVLAGEGGTGKSEMSDRFVQQGATYLSQDFTWLLVKNERPVIINTRSEGPERSSLDFLFWIDGGDVQGFRSFDWKHLIDLMFDKYPENIKERIRKILSGVVTYKYNTGGEEPRETFASLNGIIDSS